MKLKSFILLIIVFSMFVSFGQNSGQSKLRYFGKDFFLIEGTAFSEEVKESPYDRLPASARKVVRDPVWNLSKNSAGVTARFLSSTTMEDPLQ